MSVAVSPYLPVHQGLFGGKQTDLLDALLDSCQKSTMNPRLPGYGRSLQPYFDPQTTAALRGAVPSPAKAIPAKATPKSRKNKRGKGKDHSGSSASSSDEEGSRNTRTTPVVRAGTFQSPGSSPTTKAPCRPSSNGVAWAGPTFGTAPVPNDIPMPSGFLLN